MDLIHLNKQNLEDGLDLLRASRLSQIPGLCTIHLTQSARYLRAKGAALRDWTARRALEQYPGDFVTVLESRRRDLADFLGSTDRVKMIPNGVPLLDMARRAAWRAETRRSLGLDEKSLVFIAVGRMVPQKRPLHFLEKAAQFQAALPEARFLWVGDGGLAEEWDRWVAERRMDGIIRRLPWQTDVQPFLCAADIFFHVAEFEGLPLAILEALSAGLPCAVSAHLLAEMPFLTSGNSISIEEKGDPPPVFSNRGSLEHVGRAGRELAEREFSYATMAARYESAYVAARQGKPPTVAPADSAP